MIIAVYAPHDPRDKRMLWDYLAHVINQWQGEVVIMGDFNEVRVKSDRFGTNFNVLGANIFNSFINSTGLEEVHLGGEKKQNSVINYEEYDESDEVTFNFLGGTYAKITIPHLKKLDDRSIPMIYLGVEKGTKSCRLYDPKGKRKYVSRDVRFTETKPWDWDNNGKETSTQGSFWASFVEHQPITALDSPINPPTYNYNPHSEEEEEATSSSTKRSENGFDDTTVRGFKDLTEIYNNAREVETENLLFTEEEPRNYKEASTDKKWIEAMEIELDSINKNNTWTLTTLPMNHKAIGLKWVFKTKRDAKGKIIRYKARLVAKGYVQEQGLDFDEVFAPVARIEIVRLILALAAYHGWQVHHLDVKSAFLHEDFNEEVYVTQPEGFIQQGNSGKVYKLNKALYGLRQAPRAWNVKLDQTLKSLDFKKCNLEQAVYTKRSKTSTLIVGVYVDDLIITGTPRNEIDFFKSQIKDKF
ncbi:zinc finger, CCHC-type containing protein [Tanacetum coccineum]|uniref:Zinc finger, CCHC-type containing protein n=1 Tax=Tanacetum coccineum TaxID=301880 RepID=A0ABQ5HLY9_9ASTR